MFLYRGLLLAVTISSTSIVLADILFQPGYEHQYNADPQHRPSRIQDTTLQQFHGSYGALPSNLQLASYPHYYHRQYLSPYHQYPSAYYYQQTQSHYQPHQQTAHHRYRRSPDPTNAKSSETPIASRDAISAISTLDGLSKIPTMPLRKKRTDVINDKSVENTSSHENDHPFRLPGLFGLNPENMHSKHREIESQQRESSDKQHLSPKSLSISSSEDDAKLRQKKDHNEAVSHSTPPETDVSPTATVPTPTVPTTKICFNTQHKNNVMFSLAVPSYDGSFYSLYSLPVNAIQRTDNTVDDTSNVNLNDNETKNLDNEVKQLQNQIYSLDTFSNNGNNVLYYRNGDTPRYFIPETYTSLNFRPIQGVPAYYYPVSTPQRYAPSYTIPMTYTSPSFSSIRQVSTYNYPVGPRYVAPRAYYGTYPLAYSSVA